MDNYEQPQHPGNMSAWYASMVTYLREMGQDDPKYTETLEKLYKTFYTDMDSNLSAIYSDFWDGDFFIGEEVSHNDIKYKQFRPYIYGAMLVVITLLGTLSNTVVGYHTIKKNYNCPTAMRVLVLNLLLSCLLFLIGGVPLLLVENVFGYGWKLGATMCQIHRYAIYVSFYTISYALVLLLLFVFLSVLIPHLITRYTGAKMAAGVCVSQWFFIMLANIPNYLGHGITEEIAGISYCFHKEIHENIDTVRAWTILQFVFTFAVPLLLMTSLTAAILFQMCRAPSGDYSQLIEESHSSRQMATLAIMLTITFAVCWTPDKVFSLMLVVNPQRMGISLLIASDVMMCLAYMNPALNPLIVLLTSPHIAHGCGHKPIRNGDTPRPEVEGRQRSADPEEPMMISTV